MRAGVRIAAIAVALVLGVVGVRAFLQARDEAARTKRLEELAYAARWELDHGQPSQALEKLTALEQLDPQRPGLAGQVGRALVANGRSAEGLAKLVLASDGGSEPQVFEYLGVAYSQLGQLEQAQSALERAVALGPSSSSAWRRLAQVRLTRADAGGAVAAWRRAAEAAPTEAAAVRLEARTLLEQAGKPDEAKFFIEGAP